MNVKQAEDQGNLLYRRGRWKDQADLGRIIAKVESAKATCYICGAVYTTPDTPPRAWKCPGCGEVTVLSHGGTYVGGIKILELVQNGR